MRQAAVVLAIAALAACATPGLASADPFESAQPEFLNACVQRAGASREMLQHCVGALADPCIEAEAGATSGYVLCWSAEADAWHAHLSHATRRLSEAQPYRSRSRLEEANKAWSEWMASECEYWAWEEGGGAGEQVDRARCHARLAADRAITLMTAARP